MIQQKQHSGTAQNGQAEYNIPHLPLMYDLETRDVLRWVNRSSRKLAELRGLLQTIPNEAILINTLALQEAKDSSEVENIITTQDDLYRAEFDLSESIGRVAAKEVMNYREALLAGFEDVKRTGLLTLKTIMNVQSHLEHNNAGFRKVPGTQLKRNDGQVIYTPPQNYHDICLHMSNLEQFINNNDLCDIDPLIKMAIIHHQFESIHPFYDGNGRTGRIVQILYLVQANLMDIPVLYLSRYINHNKAQYYGLIQAIRDKGENNLQEWIDWVQFMLKGVEETASNAIALVKGISNLMKEYKKSLRPLFGKQYKHELLNNLFFHPYTKIEFVERDMQIGRKTATKYLDMIVNAGLLQKIKLGVSNYYVNIRLMNLLAGEYVPENAVLGT